jgi:hypothetical protein
MLPSTITVRAMAGNSKTSSVYSPFSADHRPSQSATESEVQNDHNTQMNQKVT